MAGVGDVQVIEQVRRNGPSTSFLAWTTVEQGRPVIGQVLETRQVRECQPMYIRRHPDSPATKVIVGRAVFAHEPGDQYAFFSHTDNFWIRNCIEPIE